jgi:hypothetical protein
VGQQVQEVRCGGEALPPMMPAIVYYCCVNQANVCVRRRIKHKLDRLRCLGGTLVDRADIMVSSPMLYTISRVDALYKKRNTKELTEEAESLHVRRGSHGDNGSCVLPIRGRPYKYPGYDLAFGCLGKRGPSGRGVKATACR